MRFVYIIFDRFLLLCPSVMIRCTLFVSILAPKINFSDHEDASNGGSSQSLGNLLSPFDMKRLEAYTNNCVDYHMV